MSGAERSRAVVVGSLVWNSGSIQLFGVRSLSYGLSRKKEETEGEESDEGGPCSSWAGPKNISH